MTKTEIQDIFFRFIDADIASYDVVNSSHGDGDLREAVMIQTVSGEKYVLKLACNSFTFPERIAMWERTAQEYRATGCYCPAFFRDKNGIFPVIRYKGHDCVAYVEEFAAYDTADKFETADYQDDMWTMTAQIAAKYLDHTDYPSAYSLFELFDPADEIDEVLENALAWKEYVDTLPERFHAQTERIWRMWNANRDALKQVYAGLPTSVFQADLNPCNVLLDGSGKFVGVLDFNLSGRDVFLNYLIRETLNCVHQVEMDMICERLKLVSKHYTFSDSEKRMALMLYRCIKPLWFNKLWWLKELKDDWAAVGEYLDETERSLTAPIDLASYMN